MGNNISNSEIGEWTTPIIKTQTQTSVQMRPIQAPVVEVENPVQDEQNTKMQIITQYYGGDFAMCDTLEKQFYISEFIGRMNEQIPAIRSIHPGQKLIKKPEIRGDIKKMLMYEHGLDSYILIHHLRTVIDRTHAQWCKNRNSIYSSSIQNTYRDFITKNINSATAAYTGTYIATAEITEALPGIFSFETGPISAIIIEKAIERQYRDIIDFTYGIYRACIYAANNPHCTKQINRLNRWYEETKNYVTVRKSMETLAKFVKVYDQEFDSIEEENGDWTWE